MTFYYLRQVAMALEAKIRNAVVSECFSQSKDELVVRFEIGAKSHYMRASLSPSLGCLSFPGKFERARKNSVDLFPSVVGTRVLGLRQFNNERSLAILLSNEQTLLFKMHGNRTNIILYNGDRATDLFKKNITTDWNIRLENLDRAIDWSREHFFKHLDDLKSAYFTFGKAVWRYLEERGFFSLPGEEKWDAFQALLKLLDDPTYYITLIDDKPVLSLVETGDIRKVVKDPLLAGNEYFHYRTQQHTFLQEKNSMLALLKSKVIAAENYIRKNSERLRDIREDDHYKVWADVLMANLHAIGAGAEKVVLENFYDNQRPIEIPLRTDLTPQKLAELYYRKAKNRHIEIERLEQSISQKREEIAVIRKQFVEVESAADLKALKVLQGKLIPAGAEKDSGPVPYHEFYYRDFRILVGKNAQANDVLTSKYGFKDDLWLHVKDVSGSHVLIKHQAGKNFPKDVIEYAASLAAFNSKRKNESLCPVIVTPKKFVRKRKGDPPGSMVVEKEEVVLVEPWKPA